MKNIKKINLYNKVHESFLYRDIRYRRQRIAKILAELRKYQYRLNTKALSDYSKIEEYKIKIYTLEEELNELLCVPNL